MKAYLGDAVYADIDEYGCLVLTTEDGIRATNMVVLEDTVLEALLIYVQLMKESRMLNPSI